MPEPVVLRFDSEPYEQPPADAPRFVAPEAGSYRFLLEIPLPGPLCVACRARGHAVALEPAEDGWLRCPGCGSEMRPLDEEEAPDA